MIVCVCSGTNTKQLMDAIEAHGDFDAVCDATGACQECKCCKCEIEDTIDQCRTTPA